MFKFILLSFLFVFSAQAQEIQDFDWRQKVKEKMSDSDVQEILNGGFSVNDVNGDGFVSENEYGYLLESIDMDFNLNKEQKDAKKSRMKEFFKQADKNGDSRLDKDEYQEILVKEAEFEAKARAEYMEKIASKSPEEMMEDFNKQMDKAKAALENFKNISPKEMTDNFVNNISENIADENYFQMDKDKDGCVTEDEYADYMVDFSKNSAAKNTDYAIDLSADDWRTIYREEEEKVKENCLTKEEYLRNYLKMSDISEFENMPETDDDSEILEK